MHEEPRNTASSRPERPQHSITLIWIQIVADEIRRDKCRWQEMPPTLGRRKNTRIPADRLQKTARHLRFVGEIKLMGRGVGRLVKPSRLQATHDAEPNSPPGRHESRASLFMALKSLEAVAAAKLVALFRLRAGSSGHLRHQASKR